MTDQQINEAIESFVFDFVPTDSNVPNYCHDLNAMHEAEEKVPSQLSDEYDKWLDMLTRKTLLIDELQVQLAAVTKELAETQGENTRLRAALAQSSGACVYCSLPKEQWEACQSGFPGCARADDAMGCPELGARMELDEALARIKRLEEAGDAMAFYAHKGDRENWEEAKEAQP